MYKLAILGSAKSCVLEDILKYFKEKDVEITCLSDDEHSNFFKKAKELNKKTKLLPHEINVEYFSSHDFDLVAVCDYRQNLQKEVFETNKFVNIHGSLLPAFRGNDEISRAFLAGVKVSGVTIYKMTEDIEREEILAQYPILIENLTHFDEFEKNIYKLSGMLYPIVIDKILKDEVFDFSDFFTQSASCGSSCGGCGGCKH